METALVSAATGALKSVLEKLADLMEDEYRRFKEVPKDIKFLSDELATMYACLLKMSKEEEDPDPQDKIWMNDVRELSYDTEDSIDDFMQHVGKKDAQPNGLLEKIKYFLGMYKARRRIGIEIQDLKKQIVDVAERKKRYKAGEPSSKTINHQTIDPRALVIFERASELVGIDKPKGKLVKLLMEEDLIVSAQQQPKIVSIVGSGGMGKTTLANQVYEELKGQFKYKTFLSVSRNPNMMNILVIILSQISDTKYEEIKEGSVQQLIIRIKGFLRDKRYFIVVDDIWENVSWDAIKCIFSDNSHGSKIITTTRVNDVAESCRSSFGGHIYKIRPLDMVYSRKLFHQRLFVSEEDCPPYLRKVSDQILEKCDGLPLAIIVISGLLANTERTEPLWNHVKDSIGNALEENYDVKRMMKIFSLSYFDLPLRLKTCLLYLSLFPKDYIIEKHLRVMDLEGHRQLENHRLANIGRLFQLRFLSFKGTRIDELPEEIGHLRCLETLDLRSTDLYELPKSIVNLENLVHLLGEGFPRSFPNGIAKIQALETLQCVDAFEQSLEFLQDLGHLQNMRKLQLDLYSTSSVKEEWVETLVSSLRELGTHNLSSVTLWSYPCSLLMEPWYSAPDLASLQELFATGTTVPHVPDWMCFLVNLQRLHLKVEGVGQKDLCILGGLAALLSLTLDGTKRSKEKLIVNGGVGFPRLKEFVYILKKRGMELMFAAGSGSMPIPKLEILWIEFDPAETESLCGTGGAAAFDFGIENLPCLVTLDCRVIERGYIWSPSAEASTHPNRPTLHFRW